MAQVKSLGLFPFCVPELPDGQDTSGAMVYSEAEYLYYIWKLRQVSFDSFEFSGNSGDPEYGTSFSGSATNYPQVVSTSSAESERDLVCVAGQGSTVPTEVDDFYFNGELLPFAPFVSWGSLVYKSGSTYYLNPNFYLFPPFDYNNQTGFSFFQSFETIEASGWYCINDECFLWRRDLGEVGRYTFGSKSCPIFGMVIKETGAGQIPTSEPFASVNISITEYSTWPYAS